MPSSWIVDRLSLPTFSLRPRDLTVRSVSEYHNGYNKTTVCMETRRRGHQLLYQTSAQLVMLYYMVSKKHLPKRIVPLRVPFAGMACPKVHVRTANAEDHLGACIK